ncbi:transport system membrane protein [Azorhizobium oxalatiphilum]|uniref:Transport system membrane protein n=1 Tax=Azorhizobium oxalatiphilum TaxID=980631 RepID=A0A917F792_9HYPH|nr:efflux RND transporter periplasmic adaptor subunit [Azorhizobium oxalatiphilum]GGF50785.1 transport system membrane protein [Azorhizobium oxalatiphilum]
MRRWALLGVAAIAICGGVFYTLHSAGAPAHQAAAPAAIPVTAVKATTATLPIVRSGLGTVSPLNQVDVKVRVDGQVQTIAFREGQDVRKGDLLAQVDPGPYQAVLAGAQATLQKDQAQLANAKVEEARAQQLNAKGFGTAQAADNTKAQVAVLQATVLADQAAVDTARLNLGYATITAPISGRVGLKQINEGAIVHPGDNAGLVTITQVEPIAVQFPLSQDNLPDLLAGQAKAPLSVSVDSRDGSQHLADGKLTVIDSQVDSTTGMVKLKAEFPNADRTLWPGQLVTARVHLRDDANTVTLPSIAVQSGQKGPYVFVVKPDDTVDIRAVGTGPTVGDVTAISSGLKDGETVVLSGQSRLTRGTRVAVTFSAPQAQHVASEAR